MVFLNFIFWLVPFVVVFCGLSVFSSKLKHLLKGFVSIGVCNIGSIFAF